ncbi:MAG: TetR/AcrR family transcriptional regulator [Ruminiclostridium sp.]|nr:TetR/AcrR family transcriptional regulator [Ruminiclostridium sp.]
METKEKILTAALKLFVEKGFNETPTSLISKEAGVATGTLFHHYQTKEQLINSLYLHCKERLVRLMMEGVYDQPSFRAKMKRMWENIIRWGMRYPMDYQFFMQFSYSSYISEKTHDQGFMMFSDMNRFFQEGTNLELVKKMDPELLLSMVSSMTMTQIQYFLQHPGKYESADVRDQAFNLLWDSFRN